MFSTLITEKTKMHQLCLCTSQRISLLKFFHTHTVLILSSTNQSFSLLLPSRISDVLWRWPWKGQWNGMKRIRIYILVRFFWLWELWHCQRKPCWVTAMQLHLPPLDCTNVKEQNRANKWGNSKFLCMQPPHKWYQKITHNSNVELHRPSEELGILKQFTVCSNIQNL